MLMQRARMFHFISCTAIERNLKQESGTLPAMQRRRNRNLDASPFSLNIPQYAQNIRRKFRICRPNVAGNAAQTRLEWYCPELDPAIRPRTVEWPGEQPTSHLGSKSLSSHSKEPAIMKRSPIVRLSAAVKRSSLCLSILSLALLLLGSTALATTPIAVNIYRTWRAATPATNSRQP